MNNLILLVICSLLCGVYASVDEAPVLIFTNRDDVKPYRSGDFSPLIPTEPDTLKTLFNSFDGKLVYIIAEKLSPENFAEGHRVFTELAKTKIVAYIPKAKEPNATISSLNIDVRKTFTVGNDVEGIENANKIILDWDLCRSDEEEDNCLIRLDHALSTLIARDDMKDAIFVLTGAKNPKVEKTLSRKIRAVSGAPGESFTDDNLLAYYSKAFEYNKDPKQPAVEIKITKISSKVISDTEIEVLFESTYKIVMTIMESAGYWAATAVKINDNPTIAFTEIAAPRGFSYACAKAFTIKLNGSDKADHIVIQSIQLQPKFKTETISLTKFGPAYDCVGFTSPGIWAGIFVTLVLLTILTIGITSLLDIRSMDRFDDPKSKTITINAND